MGLCTLALCPNLLIYGSVAHPGGGPGGRVPFVGRPGGGPGGTAIVMMSVKNG